MASPEHQNPGSAAANAKFSTTSSASVSGNWTTSLRTTRPTSTSIALIKGWATSRLTLMGRPHHPRSRAIRGRSHAALGWAACSAITRAKRLDVTTKVGLAERTDSSRLSFRMRVSCFSGNHGAIHCPSATRERPPSAIVAFNCPSRSEGFSPAQHFGPAPQMFVDHVRTMSLNSDHRVASQSEHRGQRCLWPPTCL